MNVRFIFLFLLTFFFTAASAQYIPFTYWRTRCSYSNITEIEASDKSSSDYFGKGTAFSSDASTIAVGAWQKDDVTGGPTWSDAGAAYIFTKVAGVWTQQEKLKGSTTDPSGDYYGESLALSNNGNKLIVGAHSLEEPGPNGPNHGGAHVYSRSGTTWTEDTLITANNLGPNDFFGFSVDISGDGDTAISGATGEDTTAGDSGAAYIYARSGTTWPHQAMLKALDADGNDKFGHSVSISEDGNTAVVGAPNEDTGGSNAGAAYVFTRTGVTWSQYTKLQASDKASDDEFGYYVAINNDATVMAISSPYDHHSGKSDAGSTYVFRLVAGVWTEEAKLIYSGADNSDEAGRRIDISGNGKYVFVGSELDDQTATDSGAGFLFKHKTGTTWEEVNIFKKNSPANGDRTGTALALDGSGKNMIIGSDGVSSSQGLATIFKCK